jgi:hypothetical protein
MTFSLRKLVLLEGGASLGAGDFQISQAGVKNKAFPPHAGKRHRWLG